MNKELESIRKEVIVARFQVLSWNLPGRAGANHDKLQL
jgi:hypothetical protein